MATALLVQPPPVTRNKGGALAEPIGLEYIAAMLRSRGHEVVIRDAWIDGHTAADIGAEVRSLRPDFVGLTATSVLIPSAWRVAEAVKAVSADIPVVIGGAHAIYEPRWTLENPAVDVAITGEGEDAILELVDCWSGSGSYADIAGIAWRDEDGQCVVNESREYPDDLDRLPFPARNERHAHGYTLYEVVAKRGCPFRCTFCSASANERRMRYRSPENVLAEIVEVFARYGRKKLYFNDDVFTIHKHWTHEFCELLLRRGLDLEWECQTRVDLVDRDMLRLMKRAGCESVVFGIDAGNQETLDKLDKQITIEQAYSSVREAREEDIAVWCNFIVGFPWQKVSDIEDTIELARKLRPHFARFFIATPYPGSPLYEQARDADLITTYDLEAYSQDSGDSILRLEHMDKDELRALVYRANMQFYLRPEAMMGVVRGYRRRGRLGALLRALPAFAEYVGRLRGERGPVVAGPLPGKVLGRGSGHGANL